MGLPATIQANAEHLASNTQLGEKDTLVSIKNALITGRYFSLYRMGCLYLLISFLLRLALFLVFGPPATVPLLHLPSIVGAGFVNDLIELLYLLIPFSNDPLLFLLHPYFVVCIQQELLSLRSLYKLIYRYMQQLIIHR